MAEKSEHEASKTGQPVETPETDAHESKDAERGADAVSAAGQHEEHQPEPEGAQEAEVDGAGNAYPTNPAQPKPYSESEDHVPDPTAMSGTLETSGTGGGTHESLKGTTEVFSDLPAYAEVHGLPIFRSDVVQGDATGQPAPHGGADANVATTKDRAEDDQHPENVAGSPDDVSAGTTAVASPEAQSYSESVIAGAADPSAKRGESRSEGPFTTATTAEEKTEGEGEKESEDTSSTPAKKTAAKKTTAAKKSA